MAANKTIVALAGGVGAARFLDGLARVVDPGRLFIIGNTADDAEVHGLHISPDLDTVMYTLAGIAHPGRGWGIRGDTFHCLEALGRLGAETWFQLGDRDLATNLYRTEMLRAGKPLSEVTQRIAASLGVRAKIVPMTDDRVRTRVKTRSGDLEFQIYFVKRRARDAVLGVRFEGARQARAAAGVTEAIRKAAAVVVCPSNPFISVGPILAVRGIRAALRETTAPVVAISPIVGGRAIKGPAAHMMKSMGMQVSAAAVAELYQDFLDVFILDRVDQSQAPRVESLGMRAVVANTIMTGVAQKKVLAKVVLQTLRL
jgi:LPPG:FO 2-phospho-L-lactate transferase